jgi:hypothetical protein
VIATPVTRNAVTSSESASAGAVSPSDSSLRAVPRDPSLTNIMSFLPPAIWTLPWSAPPASDVYFYTEDDLDTKVYHNAARPNYSAKLQIHGRNVTEMASILDTKLAIAASQNDFTEVLSPERDFQV